MTEMTAITLGGFDTSQNIADIANGTEIYSYNFSTTSNEAVATTAEVTSEEVSSFVRITMSNDNRIECIPSQQLWIGGAWKNASDIEVGDECTTDYEGTETVSAVETLSWQVTMYSIPSMASNDSCYAEGILVKI
jgi:hypothetical protein